MLRYGFVGLENYFKTFIAKCLFIHNSEIPFQNDLEEATKQLVSLLDGENSAYYVLLCSRNKMKRRTSDKLSTRFFLVFSI